MKKAAGLNRKGRRNKGGDPSNSNNNNNDGAGEQIMQAEPVRRKPTPEEAALTAKNYRLAKELSDLRVRHREECKTVSRMTMENMNLASRWREAINHVGVLKKELAMQQRRTAEALAQQRLQVQASEPTMTVSPPRQQQQQTPPTKTSVAALVERSPAPTGNSGNSLHDVAAEMDRMDRILAAHASQPQQNMPPPPPPPPRVENTRTESESTGLAKTPLKESMEFISSSDMSDGEEKKSQSMDTPVTPSPEKDELELLRNRTASEEEVFALFREGNNIDLDDLDVDDPPLEDPPSVTPSESPPTSPILGATETTSDIDDMMLRTAKPPLNNDDTSTPLFPMTASPKLTTNFYNEEYPGDISAEAVRHPRSAERKMIAEFKDIEEEEGPISVSLASSKPNRPPPPPLSSIDAFEASFATHFPDSFSPGADGKADSTKSDASEELYNPFFPSPSKGDNSDDVSKSGISSNSSGKDKSSVYSDSGSSAYVRRGLKDSYLTDDSEDGKGRTGASTGSASTPSPRNRETRMSNNSSPATSGFVSSSTAIAASPQTSMTPPQRNSPTNDDNHDSPPESALISRGSQDGLYQTPPHGQKSPDSFSSSDQPRRPEKVGASAARARYEKALQPRCPSGEARRFPRRAEREMERGASPLTVPAGVRKGQVENSGLQVNTSKLAVAQARIKERTAAFTGSGRTPSPSHVKNNIHTKNTSVSVHPWVSRPSPTDSIASKPWDEEVGDIPMDPPTNTGSGSASLNGYSADSSVSGNFSRNSPSNTSTPSPNHNRQPLGRNRPWDTSNRQVGLGDETSSGSISVNTSNYSTQQETSNDDGSPTSRFIAAGKSRRSVKQPISYAEPSLSAKLRRGDVFFPKAEKEGSKELAQC